MAPPDRSDTDVAVARDLGYTENAEELEARALKEPPVEEGWQRIVTDDDILALRSLLTRTNNHDSR